MSKPVNTVASGGLAVVDVTATLPKMGAPVSEADPGRGLAITKVANLGVPVTFDTIGIAPPVTYATWNSSDKAAITLSNNNLTATSTSSTAGVRAVTGYSSGKYCFECTMTTMNGSGTEIGVATASATLAGVGLAGQAVVTAATFSPGAIWINGSNSGSSLGSITGFVVGVAVDLTAQLIWFRIAPSGNWNGSGTANPATGVGGISISALSGSLFPFFGASFGNDKVTANFGGSAFSGAVPSGFTSGWPA